MNILCVDDDRTVRTIVACTLRRAGHHAVEAENGRAGIEALKASGFDLIITDTRMPELDGLGLIQEARRAGYEGAVIVFSGGIGSERRETYEALRVVDKPAANGELMGAVRAVVAGGGGAAMESERARQDG